MNKTISELLKEFDKEFDVLKYEQDGEKHDGFRTSNVPNSKDIKKFISKTYQSGQEQAKQEMKKKIEKMIKCNCCKWDDAGYMCEPNCNEKRSIDYKEAIEDVLTILEDKYE